jgi:hypothetical protein
MPITPTLNVAEAATDLGLNESQRRLIRYLRCGKAYTATALMAGDANGDAWAGGRRDCHYLGVEDFLLQEGKWFEPQPIPRRFTRGSLRQCFLNAYCSATEHNLWYVEGYAIAETGGEAHHAWCLDERGKVLEVTWKESGLAYLGVVFPPKLALQGNYVVPILAPSAGGDSILRHKWKDAAAR